MWTDAWTKLLTGSLISTSCHVDKVRLHFALHFLNIRTPHSGFTSSVSPVSNTAICHHCLTAISIYRVIKKSLCTWWLQYRKLQVMFEVSPASLQTFIDTLGSQLPGPGGHETHTNAICYL
jgi:hypothetical protein